MLNKLYNDSLLYLHIAKDYAYTRGIHNLECGYLPLLTHNAQTYRDMLIIPIRDSVNEIVALECRSITHKEHLKITSKQTPYMLYNIHNALKSLDYVILCEGVFDCASLTQLGFNAVATLGANTTAIQKHALAVFKNIFIALDNDKVGIKASNDLIRFYSQFYNVNAEILEYQGKDLNEAFLSDSKKLSQSIQSQISEVECA